MVGFEHVHGQLRVDHNLIVPDVDDPGESLEPKNDARGNGEILFEMCFCRAWIGLLRRMFSLMMITRLLRTADSLLTE
jgi:hypothetical protein